mmetsp:Transcript_107991/g.301130  ORF Transcript_107991/g.301130 Transcript_107991/m.301130 type:complete len:326 (+) Transcript_107991:493-1470(+)
MSLPGLVERLRLQHLHALQHELGVAPCNVQHPLHTKEVLGRLIIAEPALQEVLEGVHADCACAAHAHVGDRAVHLRLVERVELFFVHVLLLKDLVQLKDTHAEELLHGHTGLLTPDDLRGRVHHLDAFLYALEVSRFNEVNLVEQHATRERDLRGSRALLVGVVFALVELLNGVFCINERDDVVDEEMLPDLGVDEEGLHYRRGVRHAGELDEHPVQRQPVRPLRSDVEQGFHEVAANGAADAAVFEHDQLLCHVLMLLLHESVVDADLTDLVLDDCELLVALLREHVVEQRCLPSAEVAGEDDHRQPWQGSVDLLGLGHDRNAG